MNTSIVCHIATALQKANGMTGIFVQYIPLSIFSYFPDKMQYALQTNDRLDHEGELS